MEGESKVKTGIIWSAIERFSAQGAQFVLGLVIARLLLPDDYGLIAMLSIFMALSQSLIDAGFANALIQKKDRTDTDYSTVFFSNIAISVVLYLIIYVCAPYIADFYNSPQLNDIARVYCITLVINSFGIVQQAIITIALDFRRQAIASVTAVVISGVIGILLAYYGFGVWALVYQSILNNIIRVLLLWVMSKWMPKLIFSYKSFKGLFSFASKLLASSIIHTIYTNLYSLVIGKFFSATELGFYSRASSLALFPSYNCTSIIERTIYPVLCNSQNDDELLKQSFLKYTRLSCFVIFPLMIALAALAHPLILFILSDKWLPVVPLLQIICIAYMWDPIMRLNHTVINAKGRSDYFLISEIIKKIAGISILVVTIPYGVTVMCYGLIAYAFADMAIIAYYNKKITHIGLLRQLKHIFPIFILSIAMGASIVALLKLIADFSPFMQLLLGCICGVIVYFAIAYLFKYKELKFLLSSFIKHKKS